MPAQMHLPCVACHHHWRTRIKGSTDGLVNVPLSSTLRMRVLNMRVCAHMSARYVPATASHLCQVVGTHGMPLLCCHVQGKVPPVIARAHNLRPALGQQEINTLLQDRQTLKSNDIDRRASAGAARSALQAFAAEVRPSQDHRLQTKVMTRATRTQCC
jgi:hypothetical protein